MIARVLLRMTGNLKPGYVNSGVWRMDGGESRESVLSDPHTTCQPTSFSSLVESFFTATFKRVSSCVTLCERSYSQSIALFPLTLLSLP